MTILPSVMPPLDFSHLVGSNIADSCEIARDEIHFYKCNV
jgi:hypothetical protein